MTSTVLNLSFMRINSLASCIQLPTGLMSVALPQEVLIAAPDRVMKRELGFRPIRICQDEQLQTDILKILFANMRLSHERQGDLNAQLAALRAGERRFIALADKYGVELVETSLRDVQDYSERMMRAHLAELPDGVYLGEDRCDQDPLTGEPKTIRVKLEIKGGRATFDLTASDDKALGGIKLYEARNCFLHSHRTKIILS